MNDLKTTKTVLRILLVLVIAALAASYIFQPNDMDFITLRISLAIATVLTFSLLRIIHFVTEEIEGQINFLASSQNRSPK